MSRNEEPSPSVIEMLIGLVRGRRFLTAGAFLGAFLGLVVAQFRGEEYEAHVSFAVDGQVPPQGGSLVAQLGLLDVGSGGVGSPQYFAEMLSSDEILARVLFATVTVGPRTFDTLADAFEVEDGARAVRLDRGLRVLRRRISVDITQRTGVVRLAVRTSSGALSEAVAQLCISELDRWAVESRSSRARQQREFLDGRVAETEAALHVAEDAVAAFQESNRAFAASPRLLTEHDRYLRAVQHAQLMNASVIQLRDQERLNEIRDLPTLTVLTGPRAGVEPISIGRLLHMTVGLGVGTVLGAMLLLLTTVLRSSRAREDQELRELKHATSQVWGHLRRGRLIRFLLG